jgi:hypothetical protein
MNSEINAFEDLKNLDDLQQKLSLPRRGRNFVWLPTEDETLFVLGTEYGSNNFAQVTKLMSERFPDREFTRNRVRERWNNHVDPSRKRYKWTLEEKIQLGELVTKVGNKWGSISRNISGRTDHDVKNQYFGLMKRGKSLKKRRDIDIDNLPTEIM